MDRKLVRECTAHRSDALDTYQVTNIQQREMINKVLKDQNEAKGPDNNIKEEGLVVREMHLVDSAEECNCECKCSIQQQFGEIVAKPVKEIKQKGKVIVKVEIKLHNE